MSRLRIMANRREISKLLEAAVRQGDVIDGKDSTEEQKAEAWKRLAEIMLRVNILKDENQKL